MSSDQLSSEDRTPCGNPECNGWKNYRRIKTLLLRERDDLLKRLAAAQAEIDRANEVTDAEIDAVYNLRWRGHEPADTGCPINNVKAIIRRELAAEKKALEAMKHE